MIKRKDGINDTSRPYEKCLRFGAQSLTDADLLAVIIRTGCRDCDAVQLADKVLHLSDGDGGVGILTRVSVPELMTLDGIGEIKAIEICCVGELSKRISSTNMRSRVRASDPSSIA